MVAGTLSRRAHAPAPPLQRTTFEMSHAAEYFTVRELQTLTGQQCDRFVSVVLKELLDNAIDAAETAEVAPVLHVGWVMNPETDAVQLTLTDNGPGIPRDTVRRILNFTTRTSDKAVYRSPTRGAQGNALKTVLGIPWALEVRAPLVIEARGWRHVITVSVDPAGNVNVRDDETPMAKQPGTRISLTVPLQDQDCDPTTWGRAFAVFNPHLSVKICQDDHAGLACLPTDDGCGDFYQSTVDYPDAWRKYVPSDATSAWWYSPEDLSRLIFSYIGASKQRGGQDRLLREFVKEFRNLSANAKAQAVCAALPGISHLSDFEHYPEAVALLHTQMQATGKPPSPEVLGVVGAPHFQACFERWYGVKRFWYDVQGRKELHEGIPCVVEVAIAETVEGGDLWTGINFSPTFEVPCADTLLRFDKFVRYGLRDALSALHTLPTRHEHVAVAVHIVCPTLEFLDKGKTRLRPPPWMAAFVAKALWMAGKTRYQEEEQREKDAAKAAKQDAARERAAARAHPTTNTKEAVFAVLPEAWRHATGDGEYRVSARFLYYPVRKLIQALTVNALDYDYFSQTLLVEYQRQGGVLRGLYYDPRGVLYEPHTGVAVPLGTQEVESYVFPAWLYDKILYVEKKGVWPILQTAQLAERYDLAVVAGEGYATEAIRVLFAQASQHRDYQLFVLHDADPDGYNIARTLREETARMPGYAVDVVDLGLRWEDAMALGLETEEFERRRALPEDLVLSPEAQRAFTGRLLARDSGQRARWLCHRVELNAFSAPQLVTYIEQRLQDTGVRGKIIPPDTHLADVAHRLYGAAVDRQIEGIVADLLQVDRLTRRLGTQCTEAADVSEARTWIEEVLTAHPTHWWRDALDNKVGDLARDQREDLTAAVRSALVEAIQAGALTEKP
jgi:DNA topoisomerase VI subunit B